MFLKKKFSLFLRYEKHEILFETFLVSAIVAILAIRLFLKLTNYPQFGSHAHLHIAHMLWGGILMYFALMIVFLFVTNSLKTLAAFIGGLGFGTFIDELGKFITKDNNYFFQPTFAIIYIIFIIIFFIYTFVRKIRPFSPKEYLINSLEILKDAIIDDLDVEEQKRAILYLKKSDQKDLITITLKNLYEKLNDVIPYRSGFFERLRKKIINTYHMLAYQPFANFLIAGIFIVQALYNFFLQIIIITTFILFFINRLYPDIIFISLPKIGLLDIIDMSTTVISGVFIIMGVIFLWRSRLKAYIFFRYYTLISLFVIKVFKFSENPVGAFIGVLFDASTLVILNFMIQRELVD